jgi:hypothetical protein
MLSEEAMTTEFVKWHSRMHYEYDRSTYWSRIGDWGYPIQGNDSWPCGTFNHLCYEKYKHSEHSENSTNMRKDNDCRGYVCNYCKEVVPEGLRMVAFLEKL